jgi:hypothetical protein
MIFASRLGQYEKLLQQRYEVSTSIWHKGERGRNRENGLMMFLRDMLPAAYGVATGEIIPFMGPKPSPQCDIILYDRLRMPIFGAQEPTQQVPLESVYAVIECKSTIDSKALKDARRKFSAIQKLPRCPSKRRLKKGFQNGPIFYLFGYRLTSTTEACLNLTREFSNSIDVSVVALDNGQSLWIEGQERPIWFRTSSPAEGFHETLMWFLVALLKELREIDLGVTDFFQYVGDK